MAFEKIPAETWETFLRHLAELGSPARVEKVDGMPSRRAFGKKLKLDAAFAARARPLWHHRWPAEHKWYAFLDGMTEHRSPFAVLDLPGMPSKDAWYTKMRKDPVFARRVDALWDRRRTSEAVWEGLLSDLEVFNLSGACARHGIHRDTLLNKRKADPAYDARIMDVIARPELGHLHRLHSDDVWDEVIERHAQMALSEIALMPGMPSIWGIYKKTRRDLGFADRLAVSRSQLAEARRRARLRAIEVAFGRKPKRRRAPAQKRAAKRPVAAVSFQIALSRDQLYAAVAAAVPKSLPPITRDDIICDMMLAVLEGQIEIGQIKANARDFIREHWRMFGTLRDLSLDTTLFDDGVTTIGDRMAGHGADYW